MLLESQRLSLQIAMNHSWSNNQLIGVNLGSAERVMVWYSAVHEQQIRHPVRLGQLYS